MDVSFTEDQQALRAGLRLLEREEAELADIRRADRAAAQAS